MIAVLTVRDTAISAVSSVAAKVVREAGRLNVLIVIMAECLVERAELRAGLARSIGYLPNLRFVPIAEEAERLLAALVKALVLRAVRLARAVVETPNVLSVGARKRSLVVLVAAQGRL
jgi:hypothetical protein